MYSNYFGQGKIIAKFSASRQLQQVFWTFSPLGGASSDVQDNDHSKTHHASYLWGRQHFLESRTMRVFFQDASSVALVPAANAILLRPDNSASRTRSYNYGSKHGKQGYFLDILPAKSLPSNRNCFVLLATLPIFCVVLCILSGTCLVLFFPNIKTYVFYLSLERGGSTRDPRACDTYFVRCNWSPPRRRFSPTTFDICLSSMFGPTLLTNSVENFYCKFFQLLRLKLNAN